MSSVFDIEQNWSGEQDRGQESRVLQILPDKCGFTFSESYAKEVEDFMSSFYGLLSPEFCRRFSAAHYEADALKEKYKEWCRYPDMNAHHCNGNRYDHRFANGAFLTKSTHRAFHLGAAKAAAQGYDAFIAFVKLLGDPNLLAHYVNPEHRVLFRCETDEQMRQDVILEFFGSPERFARFCEAVQEKIEGQTEKEIRFDLTF